MQPVKISNKGQGRLFSEDHLEMMTKSHPAVIYSMYLPIAGIMLWYGRAEKDLPIAAMALLFAGGVLFWTFFEYAMHRWLFHMIVESDRAKRIVYTMHGVHHEYPRDKERLFMPPVPSLLVAGTLFSLFYLLMGWGALAFFPGFIIGYLAYGSMHYAIHRWAPPRMLKALWRNHHLHHYKTPDKGFGVSSVLWDVVFGTMPEKPTAQPAGRQAAAPAPAE